MHKRIVRFSRWVRFLITRFQIDIVSSRATGITGKEGARRVAEGAPLKPHFRRIDFQVLSHERERERERGATRMQLRFNFLPYGIVAIGFPHRFQCNINLSRSYILL